MVRATDRTHIWRNLRLHGSALLVRSLVGLLRAQDNPGHSTQGLTVWPQRPIMDIERGAAGYGQPLE